MRFHFIFDVSNQQHDDDTAKNLAELLYCASSILFPLELGLSVLYIWMYIYVSVWVVSVYKSA